MTRHSLSRGGRWRGQGAVGARRRGGTTPLAARSGEGGRTRGQRSRLPTTNPTAASTSASASASASTAAAMASARSRYEERAAAFPSLTAANVESKMRSLSSTLSTVYGELPFTKLDWGTSVLGTVSVCIHACMHMPSSSPHSCIRTRTDMHTLMRARVPRSWSAPSDMHTYSMHTYSMHTYVPRSWSASSARRPAGTHGRRLATPTSPPRSPRPRASQIGISFAGGPPQISSHASGTGRTSTARLRGSRACCR